MSVTSTLRSSRPAPRRYRVLEVSSKSSSFFLCLFNYCIYILACYFCVYAAISRIFFFDNSLSTRENPRASLIPPNRRHFLCLTLQVSLSIFLCDFVILFIIMQQSIYVCVLIIICILIRMKFSVLHFFSRFFREWWQSFLANTGTNRILPFVFKLGPSVPMEAFSFAYWL